MVHAVGGLIMIQISEELFGRLCQYHLLEDTNPDNAQVIRDMLTDKMERIGKRIEYAQSLDDKRQLRHGAVKQ